ncbi:DNA mismatch repair protein MLH3 isoform X3 [Ananas comosus]|uniref:DNA mismatch repair protein MLH3 isoform X3 n=1 Tax=Ananas comosus TaxID=4615 RepID=A0A6P5FEM9_ANACO|nr:DNA mismatch repair protein MLH3 isoform X3 [Ananas comosus]
MQSIKRLPRNVHGPLHSSVVLFDLPRVVEELIYNSVDAGAKKVDVFINVKACYVKVEDDGCGITREGLVILGQKYATSKYHLINEAEHDTGKVSFKGEALSSLSDISLVEVRTKARGRPNAYCKIIKGSKCLFLGIDDQREAAGTTVIVRDLFYNQPVRRKCMHSSLKKVLHLVKKCVLRIALAHPQVSFKVADIESDEELLYTVPCSNPLPLVSDAFGDSISNCLHEIASSDEVMILSGYISGPSDAFSTKAFQYLYINSRFVSKGPIHNLLNSMAASFQCSLAQKSDKLEFQSKKRQRTLGYPAFLLNLCCPISSYDLNFEPLKTVIEFKDWNTTLSFFDQAITKFWKQLLVLSSQGKSTDAKAGLSLKSELPNEDILDMDVTKSSCTRKKKCSINLSRCSLSCSPVTAPLDFTVQDKNVNWNDGILPINIQSFSLNSSPASPCVTSGTKTLFKSIDDQMACADSSSHQWLADSSFLLENHIPSNLTPKVIEKFEKANFMQKNITQSNFRSLNEELYQSLQTDTPQFKAGMQKDRFPRPCLSMKGTGTAADSGLGIKFDKLREDFILHDSFDAIEADYQPRTSSLENSIHKEYVDTSSNWSSIFRKCQKARGLDGSSSSCDHYLFAKSDLQNTAPARRLGCRYGSSDRDWLVVDSPCSLNARSHEVIFDSVRTSSEWDKRSRSVGSPCNGRMEGITDIYRSTWNKIVEDSPVSYRKQELDHNSLFSPGREMHYDFSLEDKALEGGYASGKSSEEMGLSTSGSLDLFPESEISRTQDHDMLGEFFSNKLQNCRPSRSHMVRSRSHSAPPFHRGKCKFSIINDCLTRTAGRRHNSQSTKILTADNAAISSVDNFSQVYASELYRKPAISKSTELNLSNRDKHDENLRTHKIKRSCPSEIECTTAELTKWRDGSAQSTVGNLPCNSTESTGDILDICSGLLHMSGSSLVPQRMDKDLLIDTRVLLQLDRKFIPVLASGILIIVDQHAADERIRLEELRRKVLSGEGCGITYLDAEELVLPEMGFQLLHKYDEHILKWGWICSNSNQSSEAFARNMNLLKGHAGVVTLIAVPCILGVNLTGEDLIEFIEQLVETDGSSTLPPSVIRILNYKACRGAIMFGDPLLPSECSLIVEELKSTSLCFQCAHGRPTAVPLVNMAALHEQLGRLETQIGGPSHVWHGLSHHTPGIERAHMRLNSSKRLQNRR